MKAINPVLTHIYKNFTIAYILAIGFGAGQLAMIYAKPQITCMVSTTSAMPNIKQVNWGN